MRNRDDEIRRNEERMGRGVHEGMDAGRSRNAHTQGESQESADEERLRREAARREQEGYHTPGTIPEYDPGSTYVRSRPEGVGDQAESGMDTDPYEGMRGADWDDEEGTPR
ncbi:MAG TPA: hypothetical protein VFX39_01970 [Gemmatimonadaceae bacterium]|nr:hypothetical protein [Gemmatimonadaceae bacterium]